MKLLNIKLNSKALQKKILLKIYFTWEIANGEKNSSDILKGYEIVYKGIRKIHLSFIIVLNAISDIP